MMNQDQYHASLLNKGQPVGLGWDGITKASKQKIFPVDPPNMTDPGETLKKVQDDDPKLIDLNWNNIKVSNIYISPFFVLPNISIFFVHDYRPHEERYILYYCRYQKVILHIMK